MRVRGGGDAPHVVDLVSASAGCIGCQLLESRDQGEDLTVVGIFAQPPSGTYYHIVK